MRPKRINLLTLLLVTLLLGCNSSSETKTKSWTELENSTPQWFKDAKFGIYFHWGVYNVPAYHSEWYSRNMYFPGSKANDYHLKNYGPLDKFGYKDFVPKFKAPKFDPGAWASLFAKAGARFAGPVAEHADGFSMWESKVNSWNAKDRGPEVDVVGAMEQAIRKEDLKFVTTFHHQWHWGWYPTFKDTSVVDAGNPAYSELYGPEVSEEAWRHKESAAKPNEAFCRFWADKVHEVIDGYNPDMIYFDTRLGHIEESYRKEIVEHFRRNNEARGMEKKGVILHKDNDLPTEVSVQNHEKSRINQIGEKVWQTEEPITTFSWSYTRDMELRPAKDILHSLIDVVSKNGVYLLNISPKADGTIPADQRSILLKMGDWLNSYGEAIYGTRPWYRYGEGPRYRQDQNKDKDSEEEYHERRYSVKDVRYTTKGNTVYAILLGQPKLNDEILLEAFAEKNAVQESKVTNVSLLGSAQELSWQQESNGLSVMIPEKRTETMATVLKIQV
ncbi:alpha-L-fucosidase [Fodinibius salsisoli]|uniref:alpha-L-fucosidase n=1 Tax=Fodinibius salsisoli TaxID=2820877 RepID=A0ABT3PH68_9BACT|nr:alpha-L-fucosidase [Fodinibius salsisoli]MCW9705258.1 alpha-L-fucosidase [Fodinibius salsisoli]